MSRLIILAAVLLCIAVPHPEAYGQEPQCVPYSGSLVDYPYEGPFSLDPNCTAYLRVVLHVMRDDQGQGGVTALLPRSP